jgi:hypothetical protein
VSFVRASLRVCGTVTFVITQQAPRSERFRESLESFTAERPALLLSGLMAVVFAAIEARWLTRLVDFGVRKVSFEDDFHYYWQGARRFLGDPMSLYTASSMADLRGFLYPPPSVTLFLPFAILPAVAAGLLFRALSIAALVASVLMLLEILRDEGVVIGPRDRVLTVLLALAAAPAFANTLYGQVNTFILLDCIAFRWLLDRRRPVAAGVLLALGVWIKVYPLFCLVWVLLSEGASREVRRAVVAFAVTLAAVPLVCSPFVPLPLYVVYFTDMLPATADRTFVHVLNQSLLGMVARAGGPIERAFDWRDCFLPVTTPLWAQCVNGALAMLCVYGLTRWSRMRGLLFRPIGYVCALSLIPVFSPLGWSYVYVMALPALLVALLVARPRALLVNILLLAACLAYLETEAHVFGFAARLPVALQHLLYSRFPVAAAVVGVVLVRVVPTEQPASSRGRDAAGVLPRPAHSI